VKRLIIVMLLYLFSCKSMIGVPSIISYDLLTSDEIGQVHIGDFQKMKLNENDSIMIMPAFFRKYNELNNSLIVIVRLPKKFGWTKKVSVHSKNFGEVLPIKNKTAIWPPGFDEVFFTKKVNSVLSQEQFNRISNDTIEVKIAGNINFLFALKQRQ